MQWAFLWPGHRALTARRCPATSGRRYLCRLPSARCWGRRRGKPPAPRKRGGGGTGAMGLFVARSQGFDGALVSGDKRPLAPLPILSSLRRWGKRRTLSATQGGAAALFSAVDAAETALLGSRSGCACHRDALSGQGRASFLLPLQEAGGVGAPPRGRRAKWGSGSPAPAAFLCNHPRILLLCCAKVPISRAAPFQGLQPGGIMENNNGYFVRQCD